MSKDPSVAIVMPTRNSANTIRSSLFSVVSQTYQNINVIVVDGMSTDNTVDCIKSVLPQAQIITRPPQGIWNAINAGCIEARADLIFFLNSDDMISASAICEAVEFLTEKKLDYCWIQVYNAYGVKDLSKKYLGALGIHHKYGGHSASFLIKNETLKRFGYFNESIAGYSDYDLYYRLEKSGVIGDVLKSDTAFGLLARGGFSSNYSYRKVIIEEFKIRIYGVASDWSDFFYCFGVFPIKYIRSLLMK